MGESPKCCKKGQIGREVLMRDVSIEYTGRPSEYWVKNYSGKV